MKIEVLVTLKGSIGELFAKGTVFVSPDIPQTIMEELGANTGTVKVIEADPIAIPIPTVEAPTPLAVPVVPEIPEAPVQATVVETPAPVPPKKRSVIHGRKVR